MIDRHARVLAGCAVLGALLPACSLAVLDDLQSEQTSDPIVADAGPADASAGTSPEDDAGSPRDAAADSAADEDAASAPDTTGADEPVDGPLVARWRLTQVGAREAIDTSQSGANGTLVGGATLTAEGALLDGIDDTIRVEHFALNFNGPVTITLWVQTTTTSSAQKDTPGLWHAGLWLIDKDALQPSGWGISNHYGKAKFNVNPDGETLVSARHIDDGAWHHIAAVRATTGLRWLYVDGVLEANALFGWMETISNLDPFYIGSDSGLRGFHEGLLRDVRIYKDALDAREVQSVMEGGP